MTNPIDPDANSKLEASKPEVSKPEANQQRDERLQDVLRSIVDNFSDYFASVGESIWEKRPKTIDFDEISVAQKIGQTGIQLVKVRFNSEFGRAEAGLAVKVFDKEETVKESVERINFLATRLESFESMGIRTPKIVFHKGTILIMEGIRGFSFNRSTVPEVERYRTAGKAIAALHGSDRHEIDATKNEKMVGLLIENLPVDQEEKSKLARLFNDQYKTIKLISRQAGAISFGDFHQGNLMFEIDLTKRPIAAVNLIDPEFLEFSPTTDRLEDIANFFSHKAIQEWTDKGEFFQLYRYLDAFIAGYNEILAHDNMDFFDYYEDVPPINFHLALRILFSILNLASMGVDANYFRAQTRKRIQLSQYLLKECKPLIKKGTVF